MTTGCYEYWSVRNTKIAGDDLTCHNKLMKNLCESGMVEINDWALRILKCV
jgi:hypothetical protein